MERIWKLQLNLDELNALVGMAFSDQDRSLLLGGLVLGCNAGTQPEQCSQLVQEAYRLGRSWRDEAQGYQDKKHQAGLASAEARKKKFGSADPRTNREQTVNSVPKNGEQAVNQSTIHNPITNTPLTPQGGKKRSSSGMKFPIPEEMKEALTLLCSHWPRKGHTRQGEIYDCRVWSDPQDLWDAMNKYFPDDDKKLMINCGLVYLEKINPVKGKPCEGARAMKNFYGPTEAYWKFEKEAVEERGNQ